VLGLWLIAKIWNNFDGVVLIFCAPQSLASPRQHLRDGPLRAFQASGLSKLSIHRTCHTGPIWLTVRVCPHKPTLASPRGPSSGWVAWASYSGKAGPIGPMGPHPIDLGGPMCPIGPEGRYRSPAMNTRHLIGFHLT
jgi:hypothetical protein